MKTSKNANLIIGGIYANILLNKFFIQTFNKSLGERIPLVS